MSHDELQQLLSDLAVKARALSIDMQARLQRSPDKADFRAAFEILARPQLEAAALRDVFRRIASGYLHGLPWLATFALSLVLAEGEESAPDLLPSARLLMERYGLQAKYEQSVAAKKRSLQ